MTDKKEHSATPVLMGEIARLAARAGEADPQAAWGNAQRAQAAAAALWGFARRTGLDDGGEEAFTAVQDLLAALMHLCSQTGITGGKDTFSAVFSRAAMFYTADAKGPEHRTE